MIGGLCFVGTDLTIGIFDFSHLIFIQTSFVALYIETEASSILLLHHFENVIKKWETVSQPPLPQKNKANPCPLTPSSSSPLQCPNGHQVLINSSSCFLSFLDISRKVKSICAWSTKSLVFLAYNRNLTMKLRYDCSIDYLHLANLILFLLDVDLYIFPFHYLTNAFELE